MLHFLSGVSSKKIGGHKKTCHSANLIGMTANKKHEVRGTPGSGGSRDTLPIFFLGPTIRE
ncbi:hypothetical protein DENIS_3271 [Desulfonema ishimotonii]|uniref:Uncharacterized protein n=1 Tax=Desulfonema ishimotonii TaxID=45657 RepID=A0A401FZ87_9BACT|nr:hypothetical protein DENIS_3271 [Desulfonema ishimotonii]